MKDLKLIYFLGCPNAEKARQNLRAAGYTFEEVIQNELPIGNPLKGYSSPTILKDEKAIFGSRTVTQSGGCSLDVPTTQQIKDKIKAAEKSGGWISSWITSVGSFGSAVTVVFCPICIPAFGAFLSAIGLGFLVHESVLKPILIVFLLVYVGGLGWSYLKEHRNSIPLLLGAMFAVGLYIGRYVSLPYHLNEVLEFGSITGIIAISILNLRLRKTAGCISCEQPH